MSKKVIAQPVKEPEQNNADQTENAVPISAFPKEEIEKAFNNPMLKGFKKYLDPLLNYFETVELRLQAADKNFQILGSTITKLEPLIVLSQQVAQKQAAQPQQTQSFAPGVLDIASLMPIIVEALKSQGAGGSDILQQLAMESLKADIDLSKTFKSAVLARISSNAVVQIAGAVIG